MRHFPRVRRYGSVGASGRVGGLWLVSQPAYGTHWNLLERVLSIPAAQYPTSTAVTCIAAVHNMAFFATEGGKSLNVAYVNGRDVDPMGYPDTTLYNPSRDRVNDLATWNGSLFAATTGGLFYTSSRMGRWSEPLVTVPIYCIVPTPTELWAFGAQAYRFNKAYRLVEQAPIAMRMRPVFYQGRLYSVDSSPERVVLQVYSPGSKRFEEYPLTVARKDRPFLEQNQASFLCRGNGAWYVGFGMRAYLMASTFCFCPAAHTPCVVARWRTAARDFDIVWTGDGLQAIQYWQRHLIIGGSTGLYQIAQ